MDGQDLLAFIRPTLRAQEAMYAGVVGCAYGCGALLPAIPADTLDPVVREFGRICDACHAWAQAVD